MSPAPAVCLDGTHQSYTIAANVIRITTDVSVLQIHYRGLSQQRAGRAGATSPMSRKAPENTKVGAWYRGRPAVVIDVAVPAPMHRHRRTGSRRICASPAQFMPAGAQLIVVSDRN